MDQSTIIANAATGAVSDAGGTDVDAHVIAQLVAGTKVKDWPDPDQRRAVRIRNARIRGRIELQSANCVCPLELIECRLDEGIDVRAATIKWLSLSDSTVGDLDGAYVAIDRRLIIERMVARGRVDLIGASIGRSLAAGGARFEATEGLALDLTDATVAGQLYLEGAVASGSVSLLGAKLGPFLADGFAVTASSAPEEWCDVALDAQNCGTTGDFRIGDGFHAHGQVRFTNANISGELRASGATIEHDSAAAFDGPNLSVGGDLVLDDGFTLRGELVLTDAHVSGDLDLTTATLASGTGRTVRAMGLRVDGTVRCNSLGARRFVSHGEVQLDSAVIKGDLDLTGGTFELRRVVTETNRNVDDDPDRTAAALRLVGIQITGSLDGTGATIIHTEGKRVAVNANGASVGQSLALAQADVTGTVVLTGANVMGQVNLVGATITHPTVAIQGDGLKVGTDLLMRAGAARAFSASGTVELIEASVGADWSCRGGHFTYPDGRAIDAAGITVGAVTWMDSKPGDHQVFRSRGEVRLNRSKLTGTVTFNGSRLISGRKGAAVDATGASFGQSLVLQRAKINGPLVLSGASVGQALNLEGAVVVSRPDAVVGVGIKVGTDLLMSAYENRPFSAIGRVDISGASISGKLGCTGGRFRGDDGCALDASLATIGAEALFDSTFRADGCVSVRGAKVTGDLRCQGAQLQNKATGIAFDATQLNVSAKLVWRGMDPAPDGTVVLADASVGLLDDDLPSWPARHDNSSRLIMDGFNYSGLSQTAFRDSTERLTWIRRADYTIQPYQQLRGFYINAGLPVEGRKIAVAKEDDRGSRTNQLVGVAKVWHWLKGALVSYGYRPLRAFYYLAGLVVVAALVFWWASALNVMTYTGSGSPPAFIAAGYGFDVTVPIISLGQKGNWDPNWHHAWGPPFVIAAWAFTVAGWILATMAVAGFNGWLDPDPKTG